MHPRCLSANIAALILLFLLLVASAAHAQTFTVLANYGDAFSRFSSFVQGRDGGLYGTVTDNNYGSVLKVTPAGTLTVLYNFCGQSSCTDGIYPGALMLATDGNFYGTTGGGGISDSCGGSGCGTIFKITTGGAFTVLHSFAGPDGSYPSGLTEGSDGNIYGTAGSGGSGSICTAGCGTIFTMTPAGSITTLHNFNKIDGIGPTGLVQGNDEQLYGTTYSGGAPERIDCEVNNGCGTVFKSSTKGVLTTLHTFNFADGSNPYVPVVQSANGNFYGTTFEGAYVNFHGCSGGCGTVFQITPRGDLKTVYKFETIGSNPITGLVRATDGNLYGTSVNGGCSDSGSIYDVSSINVLTYVFNNCQTGGFTDGVVQATNGKFYMAYTAEESGGNIASFDIGLGPFVAFVVPAAKVGHVAQILGQGFTGTTSVTFNGVAATGFNVVSDTFMTAVVPHGATTGPVVVTTPSGPLTSNQNFRIQ
jgi:uncharacterized repeat protein (TIGR03803 family)